MKKQEDDKEAFDDMVTRVAGYALMRLIKGDGPWRSIVYSICDQTAMWAAKRDN